MKRKKRVTSLEKTEESERERFKRLAKVPCKHATNARA